MSKLISTKRAMRILGVGSTTIKRWANENKLQSVRTAGGHRRFRLTDVESLLQQQSGNMPGDLLDVDNWIALLTLQTDVAGVRNALLEKNILTGTSADPQILRLLPPLVLEPSHVATLAAALKEGV